MNKKLIYPLVALVVVAVVGYTYFLDTPEETPDQAEQQQEAPNQKTDENIEENINGYNIEDDLEITQNSQQNENETSTVDRQQTEQIRREVSPKKENTILHEYNPQLPEGINEARQYRQYPISFAYFLVTAEEGVELKAGPDPSDSTVDERSYLDKVSLLQRVEGKEKAGSKIWYRVASKQGEEIKEGYINSTEGIPRNFRFAKMKEAVDELKQELAEGQLQFVSNYRNENGTPPQEGKALVDEHGYRVYHSAPAYEQASTEADYRYVPDGMLVRILGEEGDFYRVNIPTFNGNYYVPKDYIDPEASLTQLDQVLVVDDDQQNQALFEIGEDGLNLVSYTLATTGIKGKGSFETPPGSYKVLQQRERFQYLRKDGEEIAGYAPFATRFSGGAYVHGVPVAYKEEDGEQVDPGLIEYLHTIGTFPRSSMCVRNYTSHAKFLYNWMDTENSAVIVID
jgi:hypothetical protein